MEPKKKLLFLTGTRADFSKLKPLISEAISEDTIFDTYIFVTGMHTLTRYGNTIDEVYRNFPDQRMDSGFRRIFVFRNQAYGEPMEQVLATTIQGMSRYVQELCPDLILVHGDRVEALAGAIVGSIRNIRVAHIEGGEVSGTIDELLRHATSKLSHIHFVATAIAEKRLHQLGETRNSIHCIGSPEIELMLSPNLPSNEMVLSHYDIGFTNWAIVIFHPITTDLEETKREVDNIVEVVCQQEGQNFIFIYPNNDEGCHLIFAAYDRLKNLPNVRIYPSMREDYFFSLLRSAEFILGNSSVGIIEAPVYGVPTINISSRQTNRFRAESIIDVVGGVDEISSAISRAKSVGRFKSNYSYGNGDSADKFMEALKSEDFWAIFPQKQFVDNF